jgi:hypothetical protein
LAFKNTSDDGKLSVVQVECIDGTARSICDHARRFYPTVASEPPIYWRFAEAVFPAGTPIVQETSDSGDECHHNVEGMSDKALKKIFKAVDFHAFEVCQNGHASRLTDADVKRLHATHIATISSA